MARENMEIIRAAAQAWNKGDLDGFRELHDSDVILRPAKNWPEPGPYLGVEAVMGFYERMREIFDGDTVEMTGDCAAAADRLVSKWIWHGQGHGPESNMQAAVIHSVRNGKIREIEYFWDYAEALEAAGLSE